jgi:hypothetical protein
LSRRQKIQRNVQPSARSNLRLTTSYFRCKTPKRQRKLDLGSVMPVVEAQVLLGHG